MSFLSRFFSRDVKSYVKADKPGKVLNICGGVVTVENKEYYCKGTMVQIGEVVQKGTVLGFK